MNEIIERIERDKLDDLPEAGGVAYADLWSPLGLKICVTARGANPIEALDDLISTIKYGMEAYKLTAAPPGAPSRQAPAPAEPTPASPPAKANGAPVAKAAAPAPVEERTGTGEEIDTFHVDRIEVVMSSKGQKYIKCFGGPFTKFGVACWQEVAGEKWDLEAMEPGDTFNVDLTAKALKVDGKVKKIVGFVS